MKVILHDPDIQYHEIFTGKCDEVIYADGKYAPCQGCFGCWTKHPAECFMKDSFGRTFLYNNTVTIETDKFSTYALAYSEKSNGTPPTGSGSNSNTPSNEKEPVNSEVTSPESSGSSSSDENNSAQNESKPSDNNGNPSTGIAVSLVPLAAAITVLMVTVKRKKK